MTNEKNKEIESEINQLLRGALSAHETYGKVLKDVDDPKLASTLSEIQAEHREAVNRLRIEASDKDIEADTSSGPWGTFAKAFTSASKLLGNKAALTALKEGEEHGKREYEEASKNNILPAELISDLRTRMIPAQERHIKELDLLIEAA